MSKCKKQRPTTRWRKKGKKASDFKRPKRGHTWKGHGKDRRCTHCGCGPK